MDNEMESLLASLPGSALLAALPGSALLLLWVVIELLFCVRYRAWVRARSAEPHATSRGAADAAEALEILWKPLTSEFPPDMVRNILESWFVGDGDVCYEDVVDLYAWTLYNKRGDALSRTQRRAADACSKGHGWRDVVEVAGGGAGFCRHV